MRRRSAVLTTSGQLEMRASARDREKHAVVAVVPTEAADLGQPDAVAVELDDLFQALGVSRDAQLHHSASATSETGWLQQMNTFAHHRPARPDELAGPSS